MYASTLPRSNWLRRASIRLAWYRHMPASSCYSGRIRATVIVICSLYIKQNRTLWIEHSLSSRCKRLHPFASGCKNLTSCRPICDFTSVRFWQPSQHPLECRSNSATSNDNDDGTLAVDGLAVTFGIHRGGDWVLPQPAQAVPNVTAHPSAASVPLTVLMYNGPLLFGFSAPIKGEQTAVL